MWIVFFDGDEDDDEEEDDDDDDDYGLVFFPQYSIGITYKYTNTHTFYV